MPSIPISVSLEAHHDAAKSEPARFVDALFTEFLEHDGFASFKVEMRIMKRRQKEIIVDCGKQYRFVVDFETEPNPVR